MRRLSGWFTRLPAAWQVRVVLVPGIVASNAFGILVAAALTLVVPLPVVERQQLVEPRNAVAALLYVVVAGTVAVVRAWHILHPVVTLLHPGAPAADADRLAVLTAPRRLFVSQVGLWLLGAVLFLLLNLRTSTGLGVTILLIVGLAGWATSCVTYLIAERTLRPVARRLLAQGLPDRQFVRSVADRTMFAWGLGTGVGVIGTILAGAVALSEPGSVAPRQLAVTVVMLGLVTLVLGLLSSYVAAQASSQPIRNLREALVRVQDGDFSAEVGIYDGTEIGMLQAGFNEMLHGLREREVLRDLFGRQVGAEVARDALSGGVRLGGEAREVAVLFVDIIGSTSLADRRPPAEVVALLNRFFDVVIDVVHGHRGWINKFEGDAALAVWGAPVSLPGKHTAALRAARVMGARLVEELPELRAAIGVSVGTAVAGNVGTQERYEYTVIGDPVNEAARLTGHAKQVPGRVVASWWLVAAAETGEAALWRQLDPITVRGRRSQTPIGTPRERPEAAEVEFP